MKLWSQFVSLFRCGKRDAEMSAEVRAHLELQAAEYEKRGLSATDARFTALRDFGGVDQVKERCRDQRGGLWLDHLSRDLRHGWRMARKNSAVSAVIVFSLGIGIGVNAVIFSWMEGTVFRPVPGVANAASLQLVEPRSETGSFPGASWPEYQDLLARLRSFPDLLAYRAVPLTLGEANRNERVYSLLVSANYFSVLGMQPALGRFLLPDEVATPGAAPVAVISHQMWENHFARAPDVVGKTLRLNDRLLTIVGVAPAGFRGTVVGFNYDLWVPATMAPELLGGSRELETRDLRSYSLMGRLRPGASRAEAQAELAAAMRELAAAHPETNAGIKAEVLPFWRAPRGPAQFFLPVLGVLQGFMLLVLLAVCANAANLLLARATARRREISVRLALGARPRQILRLLLVESLLLGVLASALGLVLASWGSDALRAVPLPGGFPFRFQTELDAMGVLVTVLLGLVSSALFGLAAAWPLARTDSQVALRSNTSSGGRSALRNILVAIEVALALMVLFVAGIFLKNFQETRTNETGFRQEGVMLAAYDLSGRGYDRASGLKFTNDLLERLRTVPGVESAAIASWVPLDFHGMPLGSFKIDGRARADGGMDRAIFYSVTPGYFELMGIPLVSGQDFAPLGDTTQPNQAIVNEEFVRRYLGGASPLGHRIEGKSTFEIVGVVKNALYENFGEPTKAIMYYSYRERFSFAGQIHVRSRIAPATLVPDLRRVVSELNATVSLYDTRTLTEHVEKNLFFRRIPARLFGVLGPLILSLAAIGIYAVVAYTVAQRTVEIGVRLALGASAGKVIAQIVGETMRVVCFGALPVWFLGAVVMLHTGMNVPVLIGVPLVLLTAALLASWLPARRAARINPIVALRCE